MCETIEAATAPGRRRQAKWRNNFHSALAEGVEQVSNTLQYSGLGFRHTVDGDCSLFANLHAKASGRTGGIFVAKAVEFSFEFFPDIALPALFGNYLPGIRPNRKDRFQGSCSPLPPAFSAAS